MKITETKILIKDLAKGFDVSLFSGSNEDVMCYDNKLNCRPAYQRNYVYQDEKVKGKSITKQEQVLNTIFRGYRSKTKFPLSIMYWEKCPDGTFQILDGQQRTLSALLFKENHGTWNGRQYTGLQPAEKEWFDNYPFTVYICEQDIKNGQTQAEFEAEILDWFEVINIAGSPLTDQELRNATYFGKWVSSIKKYFSNTESVIFRDEYETEKYISINKGKMNRQEFLETVLEWRCENLGISIDEYMSQHRNDMMDTDLFTYFVNMLSWVKSTFTKYNKDVLYGQNWGHLYNVYHENFVVDNEKINAEIDRLYNDDEIAKEDGIVEYILSGDEKKLQFRKFDDVIRRTVYTLQKGNCPLCEEEAKMYPEKNINPHFKSHKDMEADHIIPWSKGGKTDDVKNCCMLCKNHNLHKSAYQVNWLEEHMKKLWKEKEKK